jgi:hypothetical protein
MEGIEEKTPQIMRSKIGPKILKKLPKWKTLQHNIRDDLTQKARIYWCISRVYKVQKPPQHPRLFGELEGSLTFSLVLSYTMKHTHTSQKVTMARGGRGMVECLPLHQPLGSYL